jgi:hypothetical protein
MLKALDAREKAEGTEKERFSPKELENNYNP